MRECCGASNGEMGYEICCDGNLTFSVELDHQPIFGYSYEKEINFGSWGARIEIYVGGWITGTISAGGTAGKYDNDCGTGCFYGGASIGSSINPTLGLEARACIRIWGVDHCGAATVTGSANISWTGSIRNNECGNCDGLNGSISLDDIVLTGTIKIGIWSGSLSITIYEQGSGDP
jgi:hypothetical protein